MTRQTPGDLSPAPSRRLLHLLEGDWPDEDRVAFRRAFEHSADIFDETGGGSRLKPRTRASILYGYRRWLGWLSAHHPGKMAEPPAVRVTSALVMAYVEHLRTTCTPRTVASQVGKLHDALRFMFPSSDWGWLRTMTSRLERAVPYNGRKPIEITSQRLIDAVHARLDTVDRDHALGAGSANPKQLQALALRYRNGLLVAIATFLPLRRSNIALLEIGSTFVRNRTGWSINLPGEVVKNGEPIDADLPDDISARVDRYLTLYRPMICRSRNHQGLWASAKDRPATGDALYNAFQGEVAAATGLHLTLHDTRRIGVTTWSVYDPANAAGAKDLLADRSDSVITQHYNLASSIAASRAMAAIVKNRKTR